jgi:hypothetical protein
MDKASLVKFHRERFDWLKELYEHPIWRANEKRTFWELAIWHKKRIRELKKSEQDVRWKDWHRYLSHVILENETTTLLFHRNTPELLRTAEGRRFFDETFRVDHDRASEAI